MNNILPQKYKIKHVNDDITIDLNILEILQT